MRIVSIDSSGIVLPVADSRAMSEGNFNCKERKSEACWQDMLTAIEDEYFDEY
jgi:hypothetical protein